MEYFAVIDTETNWSNQVMSIGVVIAEADTFKAVEQMMHILSGDRRYQEVHNAICDARDELELMRLLGKRLDVYEVGVCK